jgi:hypothetical protein
VDRVQCAQQRRLKRGGGVEHVYGDGDCRQLRRRVCCQKHGAGVASRNGLRRLSPDERGCDPQFAGPVAEGVLERRGLALLDAVCRSFTMCKNRLPQYLEVDIKRAVCIKCPTVPRHQRQPMFRCRRRYEGVIHRAPGDSHPGQLAKQLIGSGRAEEVRCREVPRQQQANCPRRPAKRRRQPCQHGERLEGRVPCNANPAATKGSGSCPVMFVIDYGKGHRHARVS